MEKGNDEALATVAQSEEVTALVEAEAVRDSDEEAAVATAPQAEDEPGEDYPPREPPGD